ncbi:MAP3K epsilon protein kinase 1 isoform X2 [Parambassis ranga]|uniref:MAP3K epsilon protein kinase 1 isoform X2 n=1 Tax=Parambassis ranga TaxID=210632 RepID=A0A6P7KBK3_9TELE|nr:MAP3K epsilon protein kinase 1-like isoform X2 [Parambassis ranga]
MFNSSTPFTIVTGGSELTFLGKNDDSQQGCEEEKDSLVQAIAPHLTHVMRHGTAKHVATEGHKASKENAFVSIVAQAEREDFQEFSPTSTQCPFSRSQVLQKHRCLYKEAALMSDTEDEESTKAPQYHLQRKQRRKTRPRQIQEEGEEPPIIRGLWVQEIDWLKSADREVTLLADIIPPPPEFTDTHACSNADSCRSMCTDDTSSSDDRGDSDSDCSLDCESIHTHERFVQSMLGLSDDAHNSVTTQAFGFDELRGRVTQIPKLFVSASFRDLMRQILWNWNTTKAAHEGLIFHHDLQPCCSQYREGEEYCILHHIQNGSYGDVFCIQDKSTGFKCAAKSIPLSHFSCEEVSTWSALNSPRVVELFGAVREGMNIVLFMDLKPACLAQLLKEMTSLPEDLALHYLHQTLEALEHLHNRNVLHLDVKVDNVLLSADCRDTFLCDFGLSETLDDSGWSTKAFRGAGFPGTESHMAPEVAQGDQLCAKADVWSSCCMLLHMLNGCQPWIRYYSPPLCLQIVNKPPPLWEVPSNCNNFTAQVFRAGLQKDPDRRASAKELRKRTTKALRAVGGLSLKSVKFACEKLYHVQSQSEDLSSFLPPEIPETLKTPSTCASAPRMHWVSPWRTTAVDEDSNDWEDGDSEVETNSSTREWDSEPKSLRDDYITDWESGSDLEVDIYMAEEEYTQEKWLRTDRDYEGDWEEEEEGDEEEEEEEEEEECDSSSTEYLCALRGVFPLLQKGQKTNEDPWGSEAELEYLRDDVPLGTTVKTPSPEPRDDPPSCFSCSDTSQIDPSEKDSDHSSDDLSSGVFSSCTSRRDTHLEWLVSSNQPSLFCFEGVEVWIENDQGECLRIRERRRVKVGHVAIGISDQISGKAFTLETLDRKRVSYEQEIQESGMWLLCVPAPNRCQRWEWRIRDGKLELRE